MENSNTYTTNMHDHGNFWTGLAGSFYGAWMGTMQIHPTDPGWLALIKPIVFAFVCGFASISGREIGLRFIKYIKQKFK